jgi:hypothetical protein
MLVRLDFIVHKALAGLDIPSMSALDSPKIATSLGTVVQKALDLRKQWSEQHHVDGGDLGLNN